jgi:hypothetical protein
MAGNGKFNAKRPAASLRVVRGLAMAFGVCALVSATAVLNSVFVELSYL